MLILNYVVSLEDDAGGSRREVLLDRSGALWLSDRNLADELRSYLNEHTLAAVEFDDETKQIKEVYPPVIDLIVALSEPSQKEPVRVQALKNPTLFELHRDNPRFNDLYGLLKQAHRDKVQTGLAIFPGSKRIQDALLLPRRL